MQPEFLGQLPDSLAQLVLETEAAIGFDVEVVPRPPKAPVAEGARTPMGCDIELDSAQLLLPTPNDFRPGSVMHELLHVRRILVDGVPRLVDCAAFDGWTTAIGSALTYHDNAFEHLVIVPQELAAFQDGREHWEHSMARNWADIETARGRSVESRQLALACWPFMRHVLADDAGLRRGRDVLQAVGLWERAESFCDALLPLLGNKEAAMLLWFQRLEIPLEFASLRYYRPLEFRQWETPLTDLAAEAGAD